MATAVVEMVQLMSRAAERETVAEMEMAAAVKAMGKWIRRGMNGGNEKFKVGVEKLEPNCCGRENGGGDGDGGDGGGGDGDGGGGDGAADEPGGREGETVVAETEMVVAVKATEGSGSEVE